MLEWVSVLPIPSLSSAVVRLSWFLSWLLITEAKCAKNSKVKGKLGASAHHIFQSWRHSLRGLSPHHTIWLNFETWAKMFSRSINWNVLFFCLTDAVHCLRLSMLTTQFAFFNVPPRACVCRSMQKLTQLERLDLGSNEFTEVVRISLPVCLQGAFSFSKPYQGDLISLVHIDFFVFLLCNKTSCFFATILTTHSNVFQTA